MATEETITVHPGDIVQDTDGYLHLVSETHGWGVGAIQRLRDGVVEREFYTRLKPGQFVVVGTAHILPTTVAQRRKDSLATQQEVERERGK